MFSATKPLRKGITSPLQGLVVKEEKPSASVTVNDNDDDDIGNNSDFVISSSQPIPEKHDINNSNLGFIVVSSESSGLYLNIN